MQLSFFIWNNIIPSFIKNQIKLAILKHYYHAVKISHGTLESLSILEILRKKIKLNDSVGLYEVTIRWDVSIWEYTYINGPNSHLFANSDYSIKIGRYCCIAMNTVMITHNDHIYSKLTSYPFADHSKYHTWGNIEIWHDVWIGMNTVILPGVKIWNWAVIWAGTIVSKNVPDYAVYAGNPWQVIKYRFGEETIEKLIRSEWWNWPIEQVKRNYDMDFIND